TRRGREVREPGVWALLRGRARDRAPARVLDGRVREPDEGGRPRPAPRPPPLLSHRGPLPAAFSSLPRWGLTVIRAGGKVWSDQSTRRLRLEDGRRTAWLTSPARSSTAASSKRTWRRASAGASCSPRAKPRGGGPPWGATGTAPSATRSH